MNLITNNNKINKMIDLLIMITAALLAFTPYLIVELIDLIRKFIKFITK